MDDVYEFEQFLKADQIAILADSGLSERQIGYLLGMKETAHFVLNRPIPHGILVSPLTIQKTLYDAIVNHMSTVKNINEHS